MVALSRARARAYRISFDLTLSPLLRFRLPALKVLQGALGDALFFTEVPVLPRASDLRAHAENLHHLVTVATTIAEKLALTETSPLIVESDLSFGFQPPLFLKEYDALWSFPQLEYPTWSLVPGAESTQRLHTLREWGQCAQWDYTVERLPRINPCARASNDPSDRPRSLLPLLAVITAALPAARRLLPSPDAPALFHEQPELPQQAGALLFLCERLASLMFREAEGGTPYNPDIVHDVLKVGGRTRDAFWPDLERVYVAALAKEERGS